MPGGQAGGAQGFGRFYVDAQTSLTITDTETDIVFDVVSAHNPFGEAIQLSLDGGDVESAIAGVCVATLQLHMVGSPSARSITMRCYHIHPVAGSTQVAETHKAVPISTEPLTFECIAYFALDVESKVRFTAQLGSGSLAAQVGGENETHVSIVIW